MAFKDFWKNSDIAFVLKRILLATIIFIALSWITLILLDVYTLHGESVTVPDLQGLYIEEAQSLLGRKNLMAEIIDSVYVKDKPLGTIVEQVPSANSSVKKYRSIFLIMNQRQVKTIPLPELDDVSIRQADALLKSLGIRVGGVTYQPSEFKDLVIDVVHNGISIPTGTRLKEGSSVFLVVGSGLGDGISRIPSLVGLSLSDARYHAMSLSFILGATNYDTTPTGDENLYVIFKQTPSAGENMPEGTRINVWLSKDKRTIEKSVNEQVETEQEEEFF